VDDRLTLDGKVAVVTGAGTGLGRVEALALARTGARLVLNDLPDSPVQEVADQIRDSISEATVVEGDIGEWSTGERLLDAALTSYGRLDILVNNAGFVRDRMIFSMSEQEWDQVIRVHLRGHFVTSRLASAHWRAQSKAAAGPVYGRIINTASEAFLIGSEGQPNYAAAKAGIAALTLSTARGCVRYGVRANAICPRARTAMTAATFGPAPAGRPDPLAPANVAPLVVYLASPAAERITGQVFVVHGGMVALLAPPRVEKRFDASGSSWTLDDLDHALGTSFTDEPPRAGFSCEETSALD
jgi:NAD(P)-dependent dehydrogenase (short-subunit alcohol dehydrogenase family)